MSYSQLELFQDASEYENSIFLDAKKIKTAIQTMYNRLTIFDNKLMLKHEDFAILKIEVLIDQIRDQVDDSPSSPKLFIWQFIPIVTLFVNQQPFDIVSQGQQRGDIRPKIIPKWINELFTNNNFSHSEFLKFTIQYFTLESTINCLVNDDIQEYINTKAEQRQLAIVLECNLFPDNILKSPSLLQRDVLNKIKNFYQKLASIQKKNWYYIGIYNDFSDKNRLLKDLDLWNNNRNINERIWDNLKEKNKLVKTFQNDNLFLNNLEFSYEQKANTDDWDNDYIISPQLLNNDMGSISSTLNVNKDFYFYFKKGAGERFFGVDILCPEAVGAEKIKELVLLASVAKND